MLNPSPDRRDAAQLVRAGAEVAGTTTGAGIGLILGGPPGALGGALVESLIKVGADFAHRQLSERQRSRAGTALGAAADRAWHRIMDGDEIRQDDFFVTRPDGGATADEVGEAVLISVLEEAEQRKVPYMGYLLANIAFEPEVDAASAHNLVADAEALSYTQLCLLSAVARKNTFPLPGRREAGITASLEVLTVLSQFEDLGYARRELIGVVPPERGLPENISVPRDQVLQYRGEVFCSLMELGRIPDEDVTKVVDGLWAGFRPKPSTT